MNKKYDIIISLGEDCACSTYMKMHKLRFLSLPFDWLTNASLETRFDLVLNNFKDFLNLEDLKIIDKKTLNHPILDTKFDYYENVKNGFHFYYDFPYLVPAKDSMPEVSDKYNRRIARLYNLIKSKKKVLFIWLSHTKHNDDVMILQKCNQICEKFNKNIDFLIIENDPSKEGEDHDIINLSNNVQRMNIKTHPLDNSVENQTLGDVVNCSKAFKDLQIKKLPVKFHIFVQKISQKLKRKMFLVQK